MGFYPEADNTYGDYFDLLEGSFRATPSLNPLVEGDEIVLLKQLLGTNFDAIKSIKTTKNARTQLLNKLILYYELHLQGFRKPKSLAVLQTVFQ